MKTMRERSECKMWSLHDTPMIALFRKRLQPRAARLVDQCCLRLDRAPPPPATVRRSRCGRSRSRPWTLLRRRGTHGDPAEEGEHMAAPSFIRPSPCIIIAPRVRV